MSGELSVRAALEAQLATLPGLMAITSSSVASATVITTVKDHGLATNAVVAIKGHAGSTPAIDGTYSVTVTGLRTFAIPVAVTVAGTGGAFTVTAWENVNLTPPAPSVPYQAAFLLFANPENREMGAGHFLIGIFQVNCVYPLGSGTSAAVTRAMAIKAAFPKAATFSSSGVNVQVTGIPAIGNGSSDGVVWSHPIKLSFKAWQN